ncbi:hypothetical protein ISCGN_019332 [Ixodes scapularis]
MNSSCVVARSLEEHLIGKKAKHRLKRGAFPTLQPQREPTASTGTKRLRSHGDHNSLGEVVTTSPVPLVTASLLAPNWPGPSHAPTAGTDDAVLRSTLATIARCRKWHIAALQTGSFSLTNSTFGNMHSLCSVLAYI